MATYSQGRYRFNAKTGYWYSGSTLGAGPYNSKPSTKAIMSKSTLTSPGGTVIVTPPVDNFVIGTTEPNATNAGLPSGWTPVQTITVDQKLTAGNQTFTDVLFACKVDVQSTGNKFIRCKFIGSVGMTGRPTVYLIHAGCNNGPQNYFERCLFNPQTKNASTDCIMGYNFRTLRCEMTGGVDGSGSFIDPSIGTDARVLRQGDYIHDLVYYTGSDTGHSDWHSHNDVNQHHNGTNVTFEGCSLGGLWDPNLGDQRPGVFDDANGTQTGTKYRLISGNCNDHGGAPNYVMGAYGYGKRNVNACFQMNRGSAATGGVTDDIHLINNWFYGGASSINIADTGLTMTTFEVRGNRFDVPLYGKNGVITANKNTYPATCVGNTYMDGTPMLGTVGNGRNNQTTVAVPADSFVVGTTKPDYSNTGVQPSVYSLTTYTGDYTITTAGTTIQNQYIVGRIIVRAANVTIRNCEIVGNGYSTGNTALIDCNNAAASNVLIEYCDLHQDPKTGNLWHNAVIGHDYTIRRSNMYNVVDGAGVYNSQSGHTTDPANVVIEGNYIHDLCYYTPDPNHTDNRTHNDGVQIQGNSNITIRGNNINITASNAMGNPQATGSAGNTYYPGVTGQCITGSPTQSRIFGLTIDSNWMDYGSRGAVFIVGTFGGGDLGTFTNNRFGSHFGKSPQVAVQIDTAAGQSFSTFSGNTLIADGSAVTLSSGTG